MLNKNKIRILISDKIDSSGLKLLDKKKYYVKFRPGLSNSEIINLYSDFDVLVIRSTRKIDKDFLLKCNFKIIASATKGLDHIDIETAKKKKIKIINSETGNTVSAAEHTFALILSICKKIIFSDGLVRKNNFNFYDFERIELRGKKIGIIGFGKVGSRVAKYAEAFEMKIFANDIDKNVREKNRNYNFKSIDFLLKNADIVTIHIPLNSDNANYINRVKLNLLNKKTILINTSRGGIVDENELLRKLKKNQIYYAGLDVFKNEPKIEKSFFWLENVVLTNHIAGKTKDSSKYISKDIFMQVKKYF